MSVCLSRRSTADNHQRRREAGLLLSSGAGGGRYRSTDLPPAPEHRAGSVDAVIRGGSTHGLLSPRTRCFRPVVWGRALHWSRNSSSSISSSVSVSVACRKRAGHRTPAGTTRARLSSSVTTSESSSASSARSAAPAGCCLFQTLLSCGKFFYCVSLCIQFQANNCVEPPPSALDMTLPPSAAERRRLQLGAHSYRSISAANAGAQQLISRPPLLMSIDWTDGRTDGRSTII